MQEFTKDPTWSKETYQRVARETGLSESQVYKWGWDQKNKKNEDENGEGEDDDQQDDQGEDQDQDDQNENNEPEASEKEAKDNTKNIDLKMHLDQAISQVVINNDELNHGIKLPHQITEAK